MGRRGARAVIALAAVLATVPGIVFLSLGAWPIVGFMGLDVALIWWALAAHQRDGRRYEEVTLWPDQLELKQVDGTGKLTLTRFNPYFVKLVIDRDIHLGHLKWTLETFLKAFFERDDIVLRGRRRRLRLRPLNRTHPATVDRAT